MIRAYHRPQTIEEALTLLARPAPPTRPLAGGTVLARPGGEDIEAVDLQALGLNGLQARGNLLELGATLTLEALLQAFAPGGAAEGASFDLQPVIRHEATYNLRQAATVAGSLVAATGRSPFATALLALDAQLTLLPGDEGLGLGDLLPLRSECLPGRLITRVTLPFNARLAYEYVARTPADQPLVCVALAVWPSGRARLALGGWGPAPVMAFDGSEPGGLEIAARSACSQAADQWASAEYRQEVAATLAHRSLEKLK